MTEPRPAEPPRPPAPLRPPNDASALEEITERADTVWTGSKRRPKVEATGRRELKGPGGRVAIVDGCRTPFVKSGTDFQNMGLVEPRHHLRRRGHFDRRGERRPRRRRRVAVERPHPVLEEGVAGLHGAQQGEDPAAAGGGPGEAPPRRLSTGRPGHRRVHDRPV